MAAQTLEERVARLEAEMRRINAEPEKKRPGVIGRTRPDFLQNYTRRSPDTPLFDEVIRAIESEREREREEAERRIDAEEAHP